MLLDLELDNVTVLPHNLVGVKLYIANELAKRRNKDTLKEGMRPRTEIQFTSINKFFIDP